MSASLKNATNHRETTENGRLLWIDLLCMDNLEYHDRNNKENNINGIEVKINRGRF